MTFDAHRHREELEAMLVGLAGRLDEPRSVAVVIEDGDVELEVIGAGEAFRHHVPAASLSNATSPAPLIEAYDRLAARIDVAVPRRELAGF